MNHTHQNGVKRNADDPRCPHCDQKLPGWLAPCDITFLHIVVISVLLLQGIAGILGACEGFTGYRHDCENWFAKRWHYVVPTYQASCKVSEWLSKETSP